MTATLNKSRTTVAIQQASAQGTAARAKDGCADCNKAGLAILPVVSTAVPNALRAQTAALKSLDGRLDVQSRVIISLVEAGHFSEPGM